MRVVVMPLMLCAALLAPAAATAQTLPQEVRSVVVGQLDEQGYEGIEVSWTLLGRMRFFAEKDGRTREIVVNPHTGEILRDLVRRKRPSDTQLAGRDSDGNAPWGGAAVELTDHAGLGDDPIDISGAGEGGATPLNDSDLP